MGKNGKEVRKKRSKGRRRRLFGPQLDVPVRVLERIIDASIQNKKRHRWNV